MIARIPRRILRKLLKPALLWLVEHQLRRANDRAEYFMNMRAQVVPFEQAARHRAVQLTERRNTVRSW